MISLWIAGISVGLLWIMSRMKKSLNMPGPPGLPIVGNMFQLDETRIHKQLSEWAKTYGDIYQLRPTGSPVVVVTGPKQIHQVLVKSGKDFSGRHRGFLDNMGTYNGKELVTGDPTALWHRQKKIMSQAIKGYGDGLKRLEAITYEATTAMLDTLPTNEPVDIKGHIKDLAYNIIHIIAMGKTLKNEQDKQNLQDLLTLDMEVAAKAFGLEGLVVDKFPWLRHFNPPVYKESIKWMTMIESLYEHWKADAESAMKNLDEVKSFSIIDSLLRHKDSGTDADFDDKVVMMTVYTTYAAGILTTSTSFHCLANIIVHYPDVQTNIYAEIQKIVGNRPASVDDRTNMPYTQAVMWELLRFTSIAPILVPHKAITDAEIDGYKIPKDTQVWVNAWGLHHDESLWTDPFQFKPERYLDEEGKLVLADHPNRVNIIPFGAGPRVCAGETFARNRLFLIIVMFLQRFELLPATTIEDQPSCDPRDMKAGFLMESLPYKVRLRERQ